MARNRTAIRWLIALLVCTILVAPVDAAKGEYDTGFVRWRSAEGGFAGWEQAGTAVGADGTLYLDAATAQPGTDPYPAGGYYGHSFYNGSTFVIGEATSPVVDTGLGFSEAIASWNADTPGATWVETLIRAQVSGRWTKWYNLGVWAAGTSTVERHSVSLQGDADGYVAVDTLVLSDKKALGTAFQLRLRLFSADGVSTPCIRNASVAFSTTAPKPKALVPGNPNLWNRELAVPACSQMVYPDGGNVWCSPTSTSMIVGYWEQDAGPCEPRVRAAVAGVYDWLYDGHGNWPFNTAYAATHGLEGYVARLTSLAQAEEWIAAGVPVAVSFAWNKGDLTGAAVPSSSGHLSVLVGFDASGNPIINDPAAASDDAVRRIYDRTEFESVWLESSGGMVYLIYAPDTLVP